jgi:hypothetical protein
LIFIEPGKLFADCLCGKLKALFAPQGGRLSDRPRDVLA